MKDEEPNRHQKDHPFLYLVNLQLCWAPSRCKDTVMSDTAQFLPSESSQWQAHKELIINLENAIKGKVQGVSRESIWASDLVWEAGGALARM